MKQIAILGAGSIAYAHLEAYKNIKDVKIAAIIDNNISKAKKMAQICSTNYYLDFDEAINNEKIDLIDICLPSFLHKYFIIKSLSCDKDVICEKPIALTLEDAQEILLAKNKFGKNLMIAHCLRFAKEYTFLKDIINSSEYGKLLQLNLYRNVSIPMEQEQSWLFDKSKSGGIVYDLHIHDVDIVYSIFGKPSNYYICEKYRCANSIFNYEGFICSIESLWIPLKNYVFQAGYTAVFEDAIVSNKNGTVEIICDKQIKTIDFPKNSDIVDYLEMYYNEIVYFLDCINNKKEPDRCMVEENVEVLKIINNA